MSYDEVKKSSRAHKNEKDTKPDFYKTLKKPSVNLKGVLKNDVYNNYVP